MSLSKIFVNNTLVAAVDNEPIIDSENLIKSDGVVQSIQNLSFASSYNVFNKNYVRYGKAVNLAGAIINFPQENVVTTLYYYIPKDCKRVSCDGYDTTTSGLRIRLCETPDDSSNGVCVPMSFDPSQYQNYHYFCVFIARTPLEEEIDFSNCCVYMFNQFRDTLNISLLNKNNGVLATYSSFQEAIAAIPSIFKTGGGLEIMYLNYYNTYERYLLLTKIWSDNENDWLNLNSLYTVHANNLSVSSLTNNGFVRYTTGKLEGGGYSTTDMFPVTENTIIKVMDGCSSTVALISAYSSINEDSYIQESSIAGEYLSGDLKQIEYVVPSGVNYIRMSCSDSLRTSFSGEIMIPGLEEECHTLSNLVQSLYHSKKDELVTGDKGLITNDAVSIIKGLLIKDRILLGDLNIGFVSVNGTLTPTPAYRYSDFIEVSSGEELVLYTEYSSGNVAHIAAYTTNDDSSYSRTDSIIGDFTEERFIEYTVPEGIMYIRVTIHVENRMGYLCKKSNYIKAIENRLIDYTDSLINYNNISSCSVGQGSNLLTQEGWVGYSDGKLQSAGYRTSTFIQVSPNDKIRTIRLGSKTVAVISAYSTTEETSYIQESSVCGGSEFAELQYIVPVGVNYIRFSCSTVYVPYFYVFIDRPGNIAKKIDSLDTDVNGNILTDYIPNVGFVRYTTGLLESGGYHTTEFLKATAGDKFILYTYGSASVAVISAYSTTEETSYIQESSLKGDETTMMFEYTVPSGVNYIRCSCNDNYLNEFYIYYNDGLKKRVSDIEENLSGNIKDAYVNFKQPSYTLVKSRCSINFSFDDGPSQDVNIKNVFDEFNKKCGFAIFSSEQRYRKFAEEGFEIIAHNGAALSNKDEAFIRNSMTLGKGYVEALGLICHGWVTPSSALPPSLRYVTNDYFEYGFTIYKGTDTSGQTMDSTMKSYDLWRVHMDTLIALNTDTESPYYNLPNYVSILADAKENNGMISVYAHGHELGRTGGWTLNDLRTILQYCIANDIEILTPYESCLKLFENRHN